MLPNAGRADQLRERMIALPILSCAMWITRIKTKPSAYANARIDSFPAQPYAAGLEFETIQMLSICPIIFYSKALISPKRAKTSGYIDKFYHGTGIPLRN